MTSLPRGLNSIMIEFTITQVLLTNILCSIAGSYLRKNRVGQISSLFSPPTAAADILISTVIILAIVVPKYCIYIA